MSNHKLAVEVARASDLLPTDRQGTASVFVELHFDHQKFQTTTKERNVNPVWDETFYFNISDPNRLHNLALKAYVYNYKKANSKSFLGKVCLRGTSFVPYSDAHVLQYPLEKRGFIFSRVKGELGLKVFVTDDHHPPNPNQAQPSVNHEMKKHEPHETSKVVPKNSGSSSRPFDYSPKVTSPNLGRGKIAQGEFVRGDRMSVSTYELVETMHYLFVRVVKALDLSCLDTYVEVKFGNYKGVTRHLEKNHNPEWNEVFAFARDNLQSSVLDVVVKHKDLVTDQFVGLVQFDLNHVTTQVLPDSPLVPKWHEIVDKDGEKKGVLMLAIWYGTQADEAFRNAWYSDVDVSPAAYEHVRSRVYHSPRSWYVRVNLIEAQELNVSDKSRIPAAYAKIQIGNQCLRSKTVQSLKPLWNEEVVLIAAEPFDEDQYLIVSVEDHLIPDKDEVLGRVSIALNSVERRSESPDDDQIVCGQWFDLGMAMEGDKDHKFGGRIHLHVCLYGGYHLLDRWSTNYNSYFQPEAKQLWNPTGVLEVGVINAKELVLTETEDGKATINPYCVAKYGNKWVRTRTIPNSLSPKYNEQYTWEVYDPVSVLTVGVFDNRQLGNSNSDGMKDKEIGKVRFRISTLESDRIYTVSYPLLSLLPSGIMKTGELHLAIRFSWTSLVNLMFIYSQPIFPKMHFLSQLTETQQDTLYDQAVSMVSDRLGKREAPLGKEVVEYMYCDADFRVWSLRRSKANFYRTMSVISGLFAVMKWFEEVSMWKDSITTVLVHVLFVMMVCTPQLILSTVFLYMFVIGLWNYRYRPRYPVTVDTRISQAELLHPDELDEEFDTFPTSSSPEVLGMRYDRLRSIAGRIQTVMADVATQLERVLETHISWRDQRATFILLTFYVFTAIVLFVTPLKVVLIVSGFYFMRHPRFRGRLPSPMASFFSRLPSKSGWIL